MAEIIETIETTTNEKTARLLSSLGQLVLSAGQISLADSVLGTITPSGSGENTATFVRARSGARIKEMTFTLRDRRSAYPTRLLAVTIPASSFGGGINGWSSLRFENSLRYGILRQFTIPDSAVSYEALVQWVSTPTGQMFWFQDFHDGAWNTYGRFEDVRIKWEADFPAQDTPATTQRFSRQTANAGTWVTFGTIAVTIPTSGSRSLQIRSARGSISISYLTWLSWSDVLPWTAVNLTTASATYLNSGWNYTIANQLQQTIIHDTTNDVAYRITMQIGSLYNNNVYTFERIS